MIDILVFHRNALRRQRRHSLDCLCVKWIVDELYEGVLSRLAIALLKLCTTCYGNVSASPVTNQPVFNGNLIYDVWVMAGQDELLVCLFMEEEIWKEVYSAYAKRVLILINDVDSPLGHKSKVC